MFRQISNSLQTLRPVSRAALIAVAVSLPVTAQAAPLDQLQSRVDQTHKQVKKINNRVAGIAKDMDEKRALMQEAGIEELQDTIRSIIQYMRHAQAGYQDFVAPDNCGRRSACGTFRDSLHDAILDFAELPQSLPFVEKIPSSVERLYAAADVVDYIPPQILYASEKAIGDSLDEVHALVEMLRSAAQRVPSLPTKDEIRAAIAQSSSAGMGRACAIDTESPHILLVLQILDHTGSTLSDVADLMQDEVTGTVAAGTSVKNPEKAAFQAMAFIVTNMKRNLETRLALLTSVCAIR